MHVNRLWPTMANSWSLSGYTACTSASFHSTWCEVGITGMCHLNHSFKCTWFNLWLQMRLQCEFEKAVHWRFAVVSVWRWLVKSARCICKCRHFASFTLMQCHIHCLFIMVHTRKPGNGTFHGYWKKRCYSRNLSCTAVQYNNFWTPQFDVSIDKDI